jgi:hypothetical protein
LPFLVQAGGQLNLLLCEAGFFRLFDFQPRAFLVERCGEL